MCIYNEAIVKRQLWQLVTKQLSIQPQAFPCQGWNNPESQQGTYFHQKYFRCSCQETRGHEQLVTSSKGRCKISSKFHLFSRASLSKKSGGWPQMDCSIQRYIWYISEYLTTCLSLSLYFIFPTPLPKQNPYRFPCNVCIWRLVPANHSWSNIKLGPQTPIVFWTDRNRPHQWTFFATSRFPL